jgi:hypothetical protein
MKYWVIVGGLAVAASASAKPLPAGMKISIVDGRAMATYRGVTVPLEDGGRADFGKLEKAELSDEGDAIVITAPRCHDLNTDDTTVSLLPVEARVENLLGMRLHLKKQYAEAAKHFAIAAAKDASAPVYATNLLSAQSMGGKLDEADQTLATLGKQRPGWFAWRLAVDPELKAMKARPSAAAFRVAKPGTARSAKLRWQGTAVAYSPLGLVAISTNEVYEGVGGPIDAYMTVIDLASNVEIARMPLGTTCGMPDGAEDPEAVDKACQKKEEEAAVPRRKVADAFLAQLGFEILPSAGHEALNTQTIAHADGRKLTFANNHYMVTAGKATVELPWDGSPWLVAFVPKAVVGVFRRKNKTSCDDGLYWFELVAAATP